MFKMERSASSTVRGAFSEGLDAACFESARWFAGKGSRETTDQTNLKPDEFIVVDEARIRSCCSSIRLIKNILLCGRQPGQGWWQMAGLQSPYLGMI